MRGGKATIYDIRCIDCAQCIRICPYHAKIAVTDTLEERLAAASGKVKVAIVSPAIFSQFENSATRIDVMKCVRQMGFDYVFDESIGYSGYVSAARQMLREKQESAKDLSDDEKSEIFPMISTTCPVVVRLIQMKYRALISHLVTLDSPMELTAQYAIDYLCQKLQIKKSLIYLCYISPCPARVTSVINPLWKKKSLISTCVGTHDVYPQLRSLLNKLTDHDTLTHEEERAIRISKMEIGGFMIVTKDGEVINAFGAITGGRYKNRTANLLDRKKEISTLKTKIADYNALTAELNASRSKLDEERTKLRAERDSLRAEITDLDIAGNVLRADKEHAESLVREDEGAAERTDQAHGQSHRQGRTALP